MLAVNIYTHQEIETIYSHFIFIKSNTDQILIFKARRSKDTHPQLHISWESHAGLEDRDSNFQSSVFSTIIFQHVLQAPLATG